MIGRVLFFFVLLLLLPARALGLHRASRKRVR